MSIEICILKYPTEKDWIEVKRRALVTVGKNMINPPSMEWKKAILKARHSPIRYLNFSILINNIPYYLTNELCRHHIGIEKYVKSQRSDRVGESRDFKPQNSPVNMIIDINAEALMTLANKRLCGQASPEMRCFMRKLVDEIVKNNPCFDGLLVPYCVYNGCCHEMKPCGLFLKKE